MVTVTFVDHEGGAQTVDARSGDSLMEAAIRNRVPGIEAQCSGAMVCGTCHSYVFEPWAAMLPVPEQGERIMLSCGDHQTANSRLACQIRVTEALEGMVVHTPPSQP